MKRLNLAIMSRYHKAAIITHSNYQLALLEETMRNDYPELMRPWRPGELADYDGDAYIEEWVGSVCVAPHIYDNEMGLLQVADEAYWLGRGYTLIEFDSLLEDTVDYGEFNLSSEDICSLFV